MTVDGKKKQNRKNKESEFVGVGVGVGIGALELGDLQGEAEVARTGVREDGAAGFRRQFGGAEDAGEIARKVFHEERRDVRGGVSDGRGDKAPLANLVEGGEARVPADEERLIVFRAADEDGGGEARVFKFAGANEFGHLARRGRFGEAFADEALRAVEAALAIPAVETLEIVAADFGVDVARGDDVRQHADFVLRSEVDGRFADGRRKAEFFAVGETFGEGEAAVAVDARARNGFVVSAVGGPGGNGIFAFGAFEKADLDGVDSVEEFGAAFGEEIGESWGGAGADQRCAVFRGEAFLETELFGAEEIAGEVGVEVHVMGAQAQRGAKDDLVEDGRRGVDEEVAAASGAHDGPEIAGVGFDDFDGTFFVEEATGAGHVAVATPDGVALAREQLSEERASPASAEDEDAHWGETLSYSAGGAG